MSAKHNFIHPTHGKFISFEGIEGCGKSTQIRRLKEYLESKEFNVIVVREPGGTKFGESLREAILASTVPIDPLAEAYLFASSRAQLLSETILPHLSHDQNVVLVDRYIDSSLAYQGIARGIGFDTILTIHSTPPLNYLPHQTFYLAITPDISQARQKSRGQTADYFEKEQIEFTRSLIDGFDKCTKAFPQRISSIDGTLNADEVFNSILTELKI